MRALDLHCLGWWRGRAEPCDFGRDWAPQPLPHPHRILPPSHPFIPALTHPFPFGHLWNLDRDEGGGSVTPFALRGHSGLIPSSGTGQQSRFEPLAPPQGSPAPYRPWRQPSRLGKRTPGAVRQALQGPGPGETVHVGAAALRPRCRPALAPVPWHLQTHPPLSRPSGAAAARGHRRGLEPTRDTPLVPISADTWTEGGAEDV